MKKSLGLAVLGTVCLTSPALAEEPATFNPCKADFSFEAALNPQASMSSSRYVVVKDEKLRGDASQQAHSLCFTRGTDGSLQLTSCAAKDVTAYAGEECYFCSWSWACAFAGWNQKKMGKVDITGNCVAWGYSGCC